MSQFMPHLCVVIVVQKYGMYFVVPGLRSATPNITCPKFPMRVSKFCYRRQHTNFTVDI
jgi:hypothetical protein